jgi:hypothetical protein
LAPALAHSRGDWRYLQPLSLSPQDPPRHRRSISDPLDSSVLVPTLFRRGLLLPTFLCSVPGSRLLDARTPQEHSVCRLPPPAHARPHTRLPYAAPARPAAAVRAPALRWNRVAAALLGCFGLRVEYAKVQGVCCKMIGASPIVTLHTPDPTVGESWRRCHAPRPRY